MPEFTKNGCWNTDERIIALAELQGDLNKEFFELKLVVSELLKELPQERQDEIIKITGFKIVPLRHD